LGVSLGSVCGHLMQMRQKGKVEREAGPSFHKCKGHTCFRARVPSQVGWMGRDKECMVRTEARSPWWQHRRITYASPSPKRIFW
jgi:hypothetical protein